jgi:hypothetical protein
MIGTAFQDVAHFLTMMVETNDSWHLTRIRVNSKTSKLFPFTGADFATTEALRLNTVSHICKTNSAGLRANLTDNPHLFAKL